MSPLRVGATLLMKSAVNLEDIIWNMFLKLEAHAALTQALAAIISMMIAAVSPFISTLRTVSGTD